MPTHRTAAARLRKHLERELGDLAAELERLGCPSDAWRVFGVVNDGTPRPVIGYACAEAERLLGEQYRMTRPATRASHELPSYRKLLRVAKRIQRAEGATLGTAWLAAAERNPDLYREHDTERSRSQAHVAETASWRAATTAAVVAWALERPRDPLAAFAAGRAVGEHRQLGIQAEREGAAHATAQRVEAQRRTATASSRQKRAQAAKARRAKDAARFAELALMECRKGKPHGWATRALAKELGTKADSVAARVPVARLRREAKVAWVGELRDRWRELNDHGRRQQETFGRDTRHWRGYATRTLAREVGLTPGALRKLITVDARPNRHPGGARMPENKRKGRVTRSDQHRRAQ